MSNRRAITFLLLLLLGAVGAHFWLDVVETERGEMMRRRALLRQSDDAVAIEINRPGGPVLKLEKSDCWRIVSPFRAVADQAGVARLTDALAFSPVVDSLDEADAVRLGRTLMDFGLDEPRLTLRVASAAGIFTVDFGNPVHSGEGTYAVVDRRPVVYIAAPEVFAAAAQPVDSWRRRTVFRASADEVVSIDIRRGESEAVRLVRSADGWEIVEPRKAAASAAAVKRMIDNILSCEAERFVWPVGASNETATASVALLTGYGLDPESCESVVFRTGDGRDHAIAFGAVADADSVYALVHGGSAIAQVPAVAKDSVSLDVGALIEGRLFPQERTTVQRVSMQDGETVCLLARGDTGAWRLDAPVSAPADEAAVLGLIDKLLVMRNSDLDDHGVKVSMTTTAEPVGVNRRALLGDGGFEQFRSKIVLEIDVATIKRLVVSSVGSARPASVVYDPERKGWNVESTGRTGVIDSDRLTAFLKALSQLKAKSVTRLKAAPGELAKYGLENPSFTIAVDRLLEGSVRRNILLGNVLNEAGDTYATVGASDAVFVLDGSVVNILVAGVLDE